MSSNYHFFYRDKDFYLRPLLVEDLQGPWWAWFNDELVTRFQSKGYRPNTPEAQAQYLQSVVRSNNDVVLAIVDMASNRHIGNVGLHQIDHLQRTAVLGIVIGEAEFRGRGIGRRAWNAITDYGFIKLNLHKISATFIEGNEASRRAALASGYSLEGRQRQQVYKDDHYVDLIHVGLIREEWIARRAESK